MAEKKQKRKDKRKRNAIILAIGFAISALILIYPSLTDSISSIQQSTEIGGYADAAFGLPDKDLAQIRADAEAYNQKIYEKQKQKPFAFHGYNDDDPEYENTLKPSDFNRIMASIEIPKINEYIPITHGANDKDLERMIGHMYGTSLPIGGANTHCVLPGHTGLPEVNLFTYITKLKKGDEFYIHVLNECHVYEVDEIHVVWPTEESPYFQIEDGQDYVTLYTCTPYGVNDHRLLVRGKRTYPNTDEDAESVGKKLDTIGKKEIIKSLMLAIIPLIVMYISYRIIRTPAKKKKNEK